jgi:hypothetical protein
MLINGSEPSWTDKGTEAIKSLRRHRKTPGQIHLQSPVTSTLHLAPFRPYRTQRLHCLHQLHPVGKITLPQQ